MATGFSVAKLLLLLVVVFSIFLLVLIFELSFVFFIELSFSLFFFGSIGIGIGSLLISDFFSSLLFLITLSNGFFLLFILSLFIKLKIGFITFVSVFAFGDFSFVELKFDSLVKFNFDT
jgi:hypothetical protein